MSSSLNLKSDKLKLGLYFWIKEKMFHATLFFFIALLFSFGLALFWPPQYVTDSEYLLKKKASSAYEAIASSKMGAEKGLDSLSIEPYFYARHFKEIAIKEAGLQVQRDFLSLKSRIFFGLKSFLSFIKKEPEIAPFSFYNCDYNQVKKLHFSIRAIGEHFFEVLYQGQKHRFPKEQNLEIGPLKVKIKKEGANDFQWYHYQVLPLDKIKKKVGKKLKVRLEKNAKTTLVFEFLANDPISGENFLHTLLKRTQEAIKSHRQKVLESEIEKLSLEKLRFEALIEENFSLDPQHKAHFLEQLFQEKKRELSIKEDLNNQIMKKNFYLLNDLPQDGISSFYKEFLELENRLLSLSPFVEKGKKITSSKTLKELEAILNSKEYLIQEMEKEKEEVKRVLLQKEYSSLIAYPQSPLLEKLFQEKKVLEKERKHLAVSEISEIQHQLAGIDDKIAKELIRIDHFLKEKIEKAKQDYLDLQSQLFSKIEEEMEFCRKKASLQLKNEIAILERQVDLVAKKIDSLDNQLIKEKTAYLDDQKKWQIFQSICVEKKALEELLFLKISKLHTDDYFGQVLSPVQSLVVPSWNLHLFFVVCLACISSLFYFLSLWFQTLKLGFFPSKELFKRMGFQVQSHKQFLTLQGKKRAFFSAHELKELKEIPHQTLDFIGVKKSKIALEDLEALALIKDKVVLF